MADTAPKRLKISSSDTVPVDRISDLPESMISYILNRLPTKDAVATSILSRSWRFRWTKITTFCFENMGPGGERSENQIPGDDLVDSVNMALLNHSGESIHAFEVWWESPNFRSMCFYTWIKIAIGRNLRLLSLDLKVLNPEVQREIHLPSSLYASGTLEILDLRGPFRVEPPNVVCLSRLFIMVLTEVIYDSDEAIHKLICGCPVLDDLAITRVNKRDNLVVCSISSPLLKRLRIHFNEQVVEDVSGEMKLIIDAPALEDLTILDNMCSHISIQRMSTSVNKVVFATPFLVPDKIVPLMHVFASVKCLKVHSAMKMERWPEEVRFNRLTKLHILYSFQWSTLMNLLDACSTLEELVLWCNGDAWRNPDRVPRCFVSSLRHVGFRILNGHKKEMTRLKFFLDNCLLMERVDICCETCLGESTSDEAKRLKLLEKVSKLSRVSPACNISCLKESAFSQVVDCKL